MGLLKGNQARTMKEICFFFYLILCFKIICCWDFNELELFDLVEEVNQNFYEILGVSQNAEKSEIRKAYRQLSAKLHPDKNKDVEPDIAEKQFRELVSVYEVLKDEEGRKRYDEILEFGLPDWRQPVFYYRRVRKLGLVEISLMLLLIVSVGHFIVIWAVYFERRFEMEEVFKQSKVKKVKKSKKHKLKAEEEEDAADDILEEALSIIPRPKYYDFLLIKISIFSYNLAKEVPTILKELKYYLQDSICNRYNNNCAIIEESDEEEEEIKPKKRIKVEKKETLPPPVISDITPVSYSSLQIIDNDSCDDVDTSKSGKDWSEEDLALFTKAVSKVPSGSLKRWEKIAELVGRTVPEVISKSKELKAGFGSSVPVTAQGLSGNINEVVSFKKGKSSLANVTISERTDCKDQIDATEEAAINKNSSIQKECHESVNGSEWSQKQQQVLEWAIKNFPKGTPDRWDKIAEHITGKTKEECMHRFKYLAELVKRKKQENSEKNPLGR